MARLTEAKCRKCRRIGDKLFLRGERCFSAKCALTRRAVSSGKKGKGRRGGMSEFGRQLSEKQRVKMAYGVLERQFKNYFEKAQGEKGDTRQNLIELLENRLDNVVFRLGWAKSRAAARQLVNHGHILVNGKKLDIPSYQVKVNDRISPKEKIKKSKLIEEIIPSLKKRELPGWLGMDPETMEAKVSGRPSIDDLGDLSSVGLIVEFYSR